MLFRLAPDWIRRHLSFIRVEWSTRSAWVRSGLTKKGLDKLFFLVKILDASAAQTNFTRIGLGQDAPRLNIPNL